MGESAGKQNAAAQGSPAANTAAGLTAKVRTTLEMIKFEHSIFALPFALTGALLAARGWPSGRQLFWIIVAMVAARSAAMTFNRIADRRLDALNPRTQARALPTGQLSLRFAVGFTLLCGAVFELAAFQLNPLAFKLAPAALAILLGYSFSKRFTVLSHLILGLCLGMSPVAAWIALRGDLSGGVLVLGAAVTFWVAGFDILYACQDVESDRRTGLHSLPQSYGIAAALYVSAALHALMLLLLVVVARLEHLGAVGFGGLLVVGALLAYEHTLVKPSDLSRLNTAFFSVNGYISLLLFFTWAADILRH